MGKTAVSIIAGLTVSRNRPIASAHNWFHEVWGPLGIARLTNWPWWLEPINKDIPMSRKCELTGKGPMSGNNVSHAKNRTRRRFLPNLQDVTLISDVLGRSFRLRISSAALRTVDHRGGFDAFLLKAKDAELSSEALKIKKEVVKASA